ncbi:MAG: hypothetical protein WKF81_04535 [Thermomicrobiales bacterium]
MSQVEVGSKYGQLRVEARCGPSIRAREAIEYYLLILPMVLGLLLFFLGPMIASTIAFLASADASCVTGTTLIVDGGLSITFQGREATSIRVFSGRGGIPADHA